MRSRVFQAHVDRAKRDLTDFFNAETTDRLHWIFNYARELPHFDKIQWHSGSVFWEQQLKVLFENEHFHWNIGYALEQLVDEEKLVRLTERSKPIRNELAQLPNVNIHRINLYYNSSIRYFIRNTKNLLGLLNAWWDPIYFKGIGVHGEMSSEMTFRRLGFQVEDRNTNEFRGRSYSGGEKNLDFILSKDGQYYGVEVKNTIGYPEYIEFQEKTFELCEELELIPWWISRYAPNCWFDEIKQLEGYIFRNKAIIFPTISRPLAEQIWYQTGIPVTLAEALSEKIQNQMIRQHDKNKGIFTQNSPI